jgi:hypothetical protein
MTKYKTILQSKAELIKGDGDTFKAIAAPIKEKYGFDLRPQIDLLYLRSCLVSAGTKAGINENDDIFTREEAWGARHTPVLKPFNWEHQDKDIVGVIYTVQARDLEGNLLDMNTEKAPECDFDLWTEAVIFKLIHSDRAKEIEERAQAGKLFVSMEAWFDDYDYGFYNPNEKIEKIIARTQSTNFLDKHLRAYHGVGKYVDPDAGKEVRIGRVLKSITFGGCGLVSKPANKRSVISDVGQPKSEAIDYSNDQIGILLQRLQEIEASKTIESNLTGDFYMNTQTNTDIKLAISEALDKRDQERAKASEVESLRTKATVAEQKVGDLEKQINSLSEINAAKDHQITALNVQIQEFNKAVDELVGQAAAGATSSTPAEIATIDSAIAQKSGDAVFKAKLSWLEKSYAHLSTRAQRAEELEIELAKAVQIVREQEVRGLFGDNVSQEAVDLFVSHAANLSDEEYETWRDQQELLVIELSKGAKKMEDKKAMDKEEMMKMKMMKMKKGAANAFKDLLEKKKSEGADLVSVETHIINPPTGGHTINSGVNPASIKTPRHKIAGSTTNDPAEALDNVEEQDSINFAGASLVGDEGTGANPFKVLASEITGYGKKSEKTEPKDGFNPIQ